MSGSGESSTGPTFTNPVEKFEEAFMTCLASLTKEDTLTNTDREEIRVDVEQGIQNVLENARMLESYFLKKRLEIGSQRPELIVRDDTNELRGESVRKDELIKKNYEKISHWQAILSELQQPAVGGKQVQVIPSQPPGGPPSVGHPGGMNQGPMSQGPMSQGPMSQGPMSQGPHTPMSQGPMTPTGGGRPNTPGSGRPQTPGMGGVRMQSFSPSMHQQSIGSPQIGPGPGPTHGLQGHCCQHGPNFQCRWARPFPNISSVIGPSETLVAQPCSSVETPIKAKSSKRKKSKKASKPSELKKDEEKLKLPRKKRAVGKGGKNKKNSDKA